MRGVIAASDDQIEPVTRLNWPAFLPILPVELTLMEMAPVLFGQKRRHVGRRAEKERAVRGIQRRGKLLSMTNGPKIVYVCPRSCS